MNIENLKEKLIALKHQHKDLELDLMEADAHWDEINASRIKKEKLKLKDEMERVKKDLQK